MINAKVVSENVEMPFPKLMATRDGDVVLFSKKHKGTVIINESGIYPHGYYSDGWTMEYYTDFHGTITLSNQE